MPGGSSPPAGSYGSGGPGSHGATVYAPAQQQSADSLYQAILGGMGSTLFPGSAQFPGSTAAGNPYLGTPGSTGTGAQNIAGAGIDPSLFAGFGSALPLGFSLSGTPAGQAYPAAQALYNQYLNPLATGTPGANLASQAGTLANQAMSGAGSIYSQAFDPQQALYSQTLNQTQQQLAAANANAGIGGTPYGQSVTGNALNNFNINWQNQLLNRELTGGQGASALAGAGLTLGQAPATTAMGALQNLTNLGNAQYLLPQQVLNDLQSYMGLGQSASQISGQLGNLGVQQQALQNQELTNAMSGVGNLGGMLLEAVPALAGS